LIGAIVAILGMAGALVTYPAGAQLGSRHDAQKLAKALKTCKKDKSSSKRKKCEETAKAKYESKTKTGGHIGATGTGTGAGTPTSAGTGTGLATGTDTTGMATGTTTSAPEATATIIVHVYEIGGPAPPRGCYDTKCPEEKASISLRRLGPNREVLSTLETTTHTIPVTPGVYVLRLGPFVGQGEGKTVTVEVGQTVEVVLYEEIE
jgi:hypothetical protein